MNITKSLVEKILISDIMDSHKLDPVSVIIEDQGQGKGRIIIECYGSVWSSYWGSMGNRSVTEFFCGCDEDCLVSQLSNYEAETRNTDAIERDAEEVGLDPGEHKTLKMLYGDDYWHNLPMRPNPDYVYLCRIIKCVQEALRTKTNEMD